jgi:transcriptional regulator with XRE-family HTH domain
MLCEHNNSMPQKNNMEKLFRKRIDAELAAALRMARKERQLTQDELARKVGLPQSSIAKIETGKADVPTHRLLEICRVLGFELLLIPKEQLATVRAILKPQSQTDEYTEFKDSLGVREANDVDQSAK